MSNVMKSSKDLTGKMTAHEVLESVGLLWEAKKEPMYTSDRKEIENHFVVRRSDNGGQLGVVGNVYAPYQNRELAQTLEVLAGEKLASFKRGWCWNGGSLVGIVAELPEHLRVMGKDDLAVQIVGWNSFDGSSPVGFSVEVLRVICSNGLKAFVRDGTVKAKHCGSAKEKILAARELLGLAVKSTSDILNQAEAMARKSANTNMVEEFLSRLSLNKIAGESTRRENMRFDLLSRFDNGIGARIFPGSVWSLYNGATEMIDHRNGTTDTEKKAISATYGSGAAFKALSLRVALDLV